VSFSFLVLIAVVGLPSLLSGKAFIFSNEEWVCFIACKNPAESLAKELVGALTFI